MSHLLYNLLPSLRNHIETVSPEASVQECIDLMVARDIGAVVVMDGEKLEGIVSERDIIRHCCHPQTDFNNIKAKDVMYRNVVSLNEHDTVERAMQVVTSTKRRHLMLSESTHPIAIISIGDLLYHLLDEEDKVIEHLEKYIAGSHRG